MAVEKKLSQLRVLVADDDSVVRLYIQKLLARMGVTDIRLAEDGKRALERIEGVDLVILDIMMPDVDGLEVSDQLARREFEGDVIIISGSSPSTRDMARLFAKALGLELLGLVKKPIDPEAFCELVSSRYQ